MSDHQLDRRTALKGLGTLAAIGAGGAGLAAFSGSGAAASATFNANDVTISSDTGDVDAVYLAPHSRVEWQNFDVPVTKVRQTIMARLKRNGDVLTPSASDTPQTQAGWWPIYRETPWLFQTTGGDLGLPVDGDCGRLSADGESVTYDAPGGTLSNDTYPNSPNHAEVFLSDGDADWDIQIRYATGSLGSGSNIPYGGWSYQENGGAWQNGLPAGYSAARAGDSLSITTPGHTHAGASATTVVDDNSDTCYIAAESATKPWDADGLRPVGDPDFSYNGDAAEWHKWSYMDTLQLQGFGGQKDAATSGTLAYDLAPSSGANAGSGPIYVVKEGAVLPNYQDAELTGNSLGQTPPRLNGNYGAVGNGDRFDNDADATTKTTTVELGLLTTLHTDYDFAENVSVPSDPNPDRLSPLAMGNSPDVSHAFGQDTHAIPYADLIANAESHPAVEWQTTSFVVSAVNEQSGQQNNPNDGGPAGTNANTGGN